MRKLHPIFWRMVACVPPLASAQATETDSWAPVRFLIGKWRGTNSGQPVEGTVVRQYDFILNQRFIHEKNTSTYPPHEKK